MLIQLKFFHHLMSNERYVSSVFAQHQNNIYVLLRGSIAANSRFGFCMFASYKQNEQPVENRHGGKCSCWQWWTVTVMVLSHHFLTEGLKKGIEEWLDLFIYSFSPLCRSGFLSYDVSLMFVVSSFFAFLDEVLRGWSGWSWQTTCASSPLSSSCPPYPARCRLLLSGSSSWTCLHWTPGKARNTWEEEKELLWFILLLLFSWHTPFILMNIHAC